MDHSKRSELSRACDEAEGRLDTLFNDVISQWDAFFVDIAEAYGDACKAQQDVFTDIVNRMALETAQAQLLFSLIVPGLLGGVINGLVSQGVRVINRGVQVAANSQREAYKIGLKIADGNKKDSLDLAKMIYGLESATNTSSDRVNIIGDIYKTAMADASKIVVKEANAGRSGGALAAYSLQLGTPKEKVKYFLQKALLDWRNDATDRKRALREAVNRALDRSVTAKTDNENKLSDAELLDAYSAYRSHLEETARCPFIVNYPVKAEREKLLNLVGLTRVFEVMLWIQWAKERDVPYWTEQLNRLHGRSAKSSRNFDLYEVFKELRKLVPIQRRLIPILNIPVAGVTTDLPDMASLDARVKANVSWAEISSSHLKLLRPDLKPFSDRYLDVFKLKSFADWGNKKRTVLKMLLDSTSSEGFNMNSMDRLRACDSLY